MEKITQGLEGPKVSQNGSPPEIPSSKISIKKWKRWVVFVLILIGLGISGYFLWKHHLTYQKQGDQIARQIESLKQEQLETQTEIARLQSQIKILQNNTPLQLTREWLRLFTALHFAQEAQYAAQVLHDAPSAIRLLKQADEELKRSGLEEIRPARQAIAQSVVQLEALPTIDLMGVTAQYQALQNLLNQFPPVAAKALKPVNLSPETEARGWRGAYEKLKVFLGSLFIVHSVENPQWLSQESQQWLILSANLLLIQTENAAVNRQTALYQKSLEQLQQLIANYYKDSSSDVIKTFNHNLQALSQISWEVNWPDVSAPYQMIQAPIESKLEKASNTTPLSPPLKKPAVPNNSPSIEPINS